MDIVEVIGKILGWIVVVVIFYFSPEIYRLIVENTNKNTAEGVLLLVSSAVRAAEQLLHDDDPTGEKRKEYVCNQLEELGVMVTESVLSMIEGEVWKVNNENKKVKVS